MEFQSASQTDSTDPTKDPDFPNGLIAKPRFRERHPNTSRTIRVSAYTGLFAVATAIGFGGGVAIAELQKRMQEQEQVADETADVQTPGDVIVDPIIGEPSPPEDDIDTASTA